MSHPLDFVPFGQRTIKDPTVGDVVQDMCRFAYQGHKDMKVRHLAEEIIGGVQSGDYSSELIAIYLWVLRNIRYTRDMAHVEFVKWVPETVKVKQADCDDVSILLAALLMSVGHRCSFVLASFTNTGAPSHVFTIVNTPHGNIVVDPVANLDTAKMLREMTSWSVIDCMQGVPGMQGLMGPPFLGAPSGRMVFSVPTSSAYDYYDGSGTFPPTGRYRKPRGTAIKGMFPPESMAVPLPPGARKVGSGPNARGMIAGPSGAVLSGIPESVQHVGAGFLAGLGLSALFNWWRKQ